MDLHGANKPIRAPLAAELFERPTLRAIVSAPSLDAAHDAVPAHVGLLHNVQVPPLAKRRGDVPRLIDALFVREQSVRQIAELGEERVAKLKAHDWPGNFDDLRRNTKRLLALIEHKTLRGAARALGVSAPALSEALHRIGL